ncbi:UNVERIFIED_CONTAM: hypothetical protein RMT77_016003 [Armadillidium vulgare]
MENLDCDWITKVVIPAALKANNNMAFKKDLDLGILHSYSDFTKVFLCRIIIHKEVLEEFCRQLDENVRLKYDVKRTFSWGIPDVYIHHYGSIVIIVDVFDNNKGDRERCQRYANQSREICVLNLFVTNPTIHFFYPQSKTAVTTTGFY